MLIYVLKWFVHVYSYFYNEITILKYILNSQNIKKKLSLDLCLHFKIG